MPAKWNGHESSCDYETEYDYLDKKLLNEGEPMTMTDTLSSNLSVDYGSIMITTDPAGASVPYSLGGGEGGTTVATYTVPDATEVVVTYDALIIGNNTQTISNRVSVKGKEKNVEVTFEDLDPGTYYVYELDAENHAVKNGGTILLYGRESMEDATGASAVISGVSPNAEISIVNKREFGSLKVEKTVTYNGQGGRAAARKYDNHHELPCCPGV